MESLILKAKSLCRSLLSSPWCDLTDDEINVRPITTGRSNRLFVCIRPSTSSYSLLNRSPDSSKLLLSSVPSDNETDCLFNGSSEACDDKYSKVIVRFYGSEFTGEGNRYKCITDQEEIAILETLSSRGMAPSILASFPGGRIDEFIESTIMLPSQLSQINMFKLVSTRIAQYHSLSFKCERTYDLIAIYRDLQSKAIKMMENLDKTGLSEVSEASSMLIRKIEMFLSSNADSFLILKMTQIRQKTVFAHMDLNYTNFLIINNGLSSSPTRLFDLMIIDVENSQNNFRGIDLGKFFSELCMNDGAKDLILISDSLIDSFVESYLDEWTAIAAKDMIELEFDNHDHLLLEIKLGFLFTTIFTIFWNVLHPNFTKSDILESTSSRIDLFNHFKQRWLSLI